jgi:hypothetical protein
LPSLLCTSHLLFHTYSIALSCYLALAPHTSPIASHQLLMLLPIIFLFTLLLCFSPCYFAHVICPTSLLHTLLLDASPYYCSFHVSSKVHATISSPLLFHYLLLCTLQPSTCHVSTYTSPLVFCSQVKEFWSIKLPSTW